MPASDTGLYTELKHMRGSDDPMREDQEPSKPADDGRGMLRLIASVFAAAFGVQSSRNRERDFTHGNYRHFIVAGILFTAIFVLTVIFVVRMVLKNAGV